MPRARQQLFGNLLLNRESVSPETELKLYEGENPGRVRLLVFRSRQSFDGLEEFVLCNILGELLESRKMRVLLSTVVQNDAVVLIPDVQPEELVPAVRRLEREFMRIREEPVRAALSKSGETGSLAALYRQTEELFRIGEPLKKEVLLHNGMFEGKKQDMDILVDFAVVGVTQDYALLLQSLQLTFLRMQKRKYSLLEKADLMDGVIRLLFGESLKTDPGDLEDESGQALLVAAAGQINRLTVKALPDDKESMRYRAALEAIYRHFQDQKLCLHYLATEVLYINEDYFGRFFQKMSGKKFTKFVLDARMSAAEQIMRLEPDIMVYMVSEMTGYASDGQYFAKTFKKSTGMTPSEYREKVLAERGME